MNHAALLLGSNQGDSRQLLARSIALIAQHIGRVTHCSTAYQTRPWGNFDTEHPSPFLNCALLVDTTLDAYQVLEQALAIETLLGRQRSTPSTPRTLPNAPRVYTSRPIDIDLIFFNHAVIHSPSLILPHPRMHQRLFVLQPLADIMPRYRHPLLGTTVATLCRQLAATTPAADLPQPTAPLPPPDLAIS